MGSISSRYSIVDAAHSEAAAARGVALIRESKGEMLMKGSLHTDELMREVTAGRAVCARTADQPRLRDGCSDLRRTVFVTDAAINIFPDLDGKRDIIQNAIDLFARSASATPRWSRSCRRWRP